MFHTRVMSSPCHYHFKIMWDLKKINPCHPISPSSLYITIKSLPLLLLWPNLLLHHYRFHHPTLNSPLKYFHIHCHHKKIEKNIHHPSYITIVKIHHIHNNKLKSTSKSRMSLSLSKLNSTKPITKKLSQLQISFKLYRGERWNLQYLCAKILVRWFKN